MRVFCRVVDLGSFTLAATQLGMSPAAVTRNVSVLEAHLNVKLINRSTRRLQLTEAGSEYREGCRTILEDLAIVESSIARSTRKATGRYGSVAGVYSPRFTYANYWRLTGARKTQSNSIFGPST